MKITGHEIIMRSWDPNLVFKYRVQNVEPENPRPLTGPEDRLELSRKARGFGYRDQLIERAGESVSISERDRRLMEILEHLVTAVTGWRGAHRSPLLLGPTTEKRFGLDGGDRGVSEGKGSGGGEGIKRVDITT